MKIEEIKKIFEIEMEMIDTFILKSLHSNITLVSDVGKYVILYGGKRVRPLLTVLFGKIFECDLSKTISIASAIELIHTATLLHDDVVDLSDKRRGKLTVNKLWGNKEAILVGDFLYTRSFQMMVGVDSLSVLKLMADTTNIMSEGEVYQLVNRGNFDITESDCINIIKCKTAQLFSAATSVSCIISKSNEDIRSAIADYGFYLGIAYQLIDDVLDYSTDDIRFGKNIGVDIINSTFTLPLVYAMNKNSSNKKIIKEILSNELTDINILNIRKLVLESGAVDYTFQLANTYIDRAKNSLSNISDSYYVNLARFLAEFILSRKY